MLTKLLTKSWSAGRTGWKIRPEKRKVSGLFCLRQNVFEKTKNPSAF